MPKEKPGELMNQAIRQSASTNRVTVGGAPDEDSPSMQASRWWQRALRSTYLLDEGDDGDRGEGGR